MFRVYWNGNYLDFDNEEDAMIFAEDRYMAGVEHIKVVDEYENIIVEFEN